MKDYNREERVKKIVESNEYLIEIIKSRKIPTQLKEVIYGKQTFRFHNNVERSNSLG
jgi:hypothetical protein